MTTLEILQAGRELISDEKRWTQNAFARDANGERLMDGADRNAVCWCSMGALEKVCVRRKSKALGRSFDALAKFMNGTLIAFNDTMAYAEVLAAWDAAIEAEKAMQR